MLGKMIRIFCCGIFMTGCALTRGEIDLRVDEGPNPNSQMTVKITEVVDNRVFEENPPDPSTPSLSKDEIRNRSIEKRAIARKRGGFGRALGDILLPEGRTVEQVTKEALVKALKESGIRVVSEGEPGYEAAIPLQADIRHFWAWSTPGFSEIALEFKALVVLKGDWPVTGSTREISGYARVTDIMAATEQWKKVFREGIDDLITNVRRAISTTSDKMSRLLHSFDAEDLKTS